LLGIKGATMSYKFSRRPGYGDSRGTGTGPERRCDDVLQVFVQGLEESGESPVPGGQRGRSGEAGMNGGVGWHTSFLVSGYRKERLESEIEDGSSLKTRGK
jgi:hypothetical protein